MIVMSFLVVPLSAHADSGSTNDISKEEYCREFKKLVFPNDDAYFSRWNSHELKVFLDGEDAEVAYAKELFTKFEQLTNVKIVYTSKKVSIALVFWEDIYRYALVTGEKLFKNWYSEKLDLYEYYKKNAEIGHWNFFLQDKTPTSKQMVYNVGIFEAPMSAESIEIFEENKKTIELAVTASLFPYNSDTAVISLTGVEAVEFSPLTNSSHTPLIQYWYGLDAMVPGIEKEQAVCIE